MDALPLLIPARYARHFGGRSALTQRLPGGGRVSASPRFRREEVREGSGGTRPRLRRNSRPPCAARGGNIGVPPPPGEERWRRFPPQRDGRIEAPPRPVRFSARDVLNSLPVPCPSGRRIMSRKHVWGLTPPWVQIPPVPPPLANALPDSLREWQGIRNWWVFVWRLSARASRFARRCGELAGARRRAGWARTRFARRRARGGRTRFARRRARGGTYALCASPGRSGRARWRSPPLAGQAPAGRRAVLATECNVEAGIVGGSVDGSGPRSGPAPVADRPAFGLPGHGGGAGVRQRRGRAAHGPRASALAVGQRSPPVTGCPAAPPPPGHRRATPQRTAPPGRRPGLCPRW